MTTLFHITWTCFVYTQLVGLSEGNLVLLKMTNMSCLIKPWSEKNMHGVLKPQTSIAMSKMYIKCVQAL